MAVLVFAAAAWHLRPRDQWIGWTDEQRRRRLALVANNVRFLLLPERPVPDLGSATLSCLVARLSAAWQAPYAHPLLVVETFVDPEYFHGPVYHAGGWTELGQPKGNGRKVRAITKKRTTGRNASSRANWCATRAAPCRPNSSNPRSRQSRRRCPAQHAQGGRAALARRALPRRARLPLLPRTVSSLCPARDRGLHPSRRRAARPERSGHVCPPPLLGPTRCARCAGHRRGRISCPPSQPTFSRLFKRLSAPRVERALLDYQHQVRGAPSATEIVVLDGKVPAHSGGLNVVSAVTSPSQYFLGSEVVAAKTNEIPAARALLERLDLTGRLVSFDAMHPQDATARAIVMEHGGDFLLTVKANQPNVQTAVQTCEHQRERQGSSAI